MFRIICDPSSGSIELYLTEICSGSLVFVVCLVGVWQRKFEPVVCLWVQNDGLGTSSQPVVCVWVQYNGSSTIMSTIARTFQGNLRDPQFLSKIIPGDRWEVGLEVQSENQETVISVEEPIISMLPPPPHHPPKRKKVRKDCSKLKSMFVMTLQSHALWILTKGTNRKPTLLQWHFTPSAEKWMVRNDLKSGIQATFPPTWQCICSLCFVYMWISALNKMNVIPDPPSSPDLVACDYFLFP